MPQFIFSTAMTANQLGLNPLAGWQYEYLQMWPANVLLLVRSTTTGSRITIYSGSETILPLTPGSLPRAIASSSRLMKWLEEHPLSMASSSSIR